MNSKVIITGTAGDTGNIADSVVGNADLQDVLAVKLVSDKNYYNNEILNNTFLCNNK